MSRVNPSHGPKQPIRQKAVDVNREVVELSDETRMVGEHALQAVAGSMARPLSARSISRGSRNPKVTNVFRARVR